MAKATVTSTVSLRVQDMRQWSVPVGPICEMTYSPSVTHFSLWSPKADGVNVMIYNRREGGVPIDSLSLNRNADGTWSVNAEGDMRGLYYTFQVMVDGKLLPETPGIFAKAVSVNGQRAQIIDMRDTDPEGWDDDKRPLLRSFADVVLYEMHHRDFSVDAESGIVNKGKFLALTEHGTKNLQGYSTGIDHLKELGITHVHLMPSYDFGSVNEALAHLHDSLSASNSSFGNIPSAQYNWGYDPVNYNVPEGSYSTNPYDGAVRVLEFKQMVLALHKAGMRVVLDVVYNHVYDAQSSQFERTAPGYFFRRCSNGKLSNGSGCGNETASEMPMMRKYIVESVLYWIREYHIDGFRFDLMGLHDIETMNAIRQAVDAIDPTILIYGEGWAASTPALSLDRLAMKSNVIRMLGIAAFCDEMRDGLRGGWADDGEGAFLIGKPGHEESVKYGIVGGVHHPQVDMTRVNYSKTPWATQPTQMIAYVSCHDDMCIADRLKTTLQAQHSFKGKGGGIATLPIESICDSQDFTSNLVCLQKLAETAVLTSQGIPFIWCGDEILRDKKGVRNSYCSPDSINAIPWVNKTRHHDLFVYVQQLISMRKAHPAFRMGNADAVRAHLKFLPYKGANVIVYHLDGSAVGDEWKDIIVVLNGRSSSARVNVPQGLYTIVCRDGEVNLDGIALHKGKTVTVASQSALIMYRQ